MAQREGFRDWLDRLHPAGLLYSTYEQRLIAELDKTRLPKHVAVLADGNRRWARLNAPGETLVTGYRVTDQFDQSGREPLRERLDGAAWYPATVIPPVHVQAVLGAIENEQAVSRSLAGTTAQPQSE